jgi:mono/diheme cytochrome c family protein
MHPYHKARLATRALLARVAAIALTAAIGTACRESSAKASNEPSRVERGRYLVSIAGCHDCHTPWKMGPTGPGPDMSRMLSGHPESVNVSPPPIFPADGSWQSGTAATNTAFAGPWGVSFTANLTPDQNTGLGIWTERMFVTAIRTGKHMATSRPILPPMPWPVYRNMTDEDLKAMFAYLRSIPPITNHVPDPVPPAGLPAGN